MRFRKITALAGSVLMAGLSVATAAAATYPAPFVDNGVADVAIVYGTGTGVSSVDMVQAGNIQSSLSEFVDSKGSISVEGGEAFTLEKTSDKTNFGENLNSVYTSLDKDELDFLADGTYDDGDIDTDYEQSINLSDKTLELFADKDYNDDEPTVGFWWTNGQYVLSYTVDFDDDEVNYTEMDDTEMPFLGASYYVLDADSDQIDVLDTAEKYTLDMGETTTIGGKEITADFIGDTEVTFIVDGERTDNLAEAEEYELDDGSYIVATTLYTSGKDSVTNSVEFAIGEGKISFINGEEIELNGEDVDGIESTITSGTGNNFLNGLTLTWNSDDDTWLTEEDSISMPSFETIQLVFGGLDFPSDSETITVSEGETLTLEMDNYDLPVAWFNGSVAMLGEEDYELVLTESNYTYAALGYDNASTPVGFDSAIINTSNMTTEGLNLSVDDRFVVTKIDDDLSNVETAYYEVKNIDVDDATTFTVELEDLIGDDDLEFDDLETDEAGDIEVELKGFAADNESIILEFTGVGDGTIYYNKVVSDMGMVIDLPTSVAYYYNGTGATLTFTEADKDENVNEGASFEVTIKNSTNDKLHTSTHNLTAYTEEESDNKNMGYVPSDLASMIYYDTSADENNFEVKYYGKEVMADVQVVVNGEVSSSTTNALGDVMVKDSEVSTVNADNLVIVGGSCINSAAATILGGAYCGEEFTAATNVGSGEFLIKGYENSAINSKFALLVAGYEAADTANAATYLTNKDVDTSSTYVGTSGTTAEVMVE